MMIYHWQAKFYSQMPAHYIFKIFTVSMTAYFYLQCVEFKGSYNLPEYHHQCCYLQYHWLLGHATSLQEEMDKN